MLNNGGSSVYSLLTIGRLATRSLLSGFHPLDSADSNGPSTSSNLCSRLATTRRFMRRTTVSCSGQPDPKKADLRQGGGDSGSSGGEQRSARFVTACCGFGKDMAHGASHNRDAHVFGDDACFVAHHRTGDVVGVADGVGGWRQYGVDPSLFSRSLMERCKELVDSGEFTPRHPEKLLATAFAQMYQERLDFKYKEAKPDCEPLIGSSTACIVMLDRSDSQLYFANLGDSGFLVLRAGKVVHRSEEQCHYFNAPYQLALPPNIDQSIGFFSDTADDAELSSFVVQDGDVILVATDGLFDNLPTELIEKELSNKAAATSGDTATTARLQEQCNSVALMARRLALDRDYLSPFAAKARANGMNGVVGGKPDDITVILVRVTFAKDTDAPAVTPRAKI